MLKASVADDAARQAYAARAAGLLADRDRYIAARIRDTLPAGGSGVLFIGLQHGVARVLPGRHRRHQPALLPRDAAVNRRWASHAPRLRVSGTAGHVNHSGTVTAGAGQMALALECLPSPSQRGQAACGSGTVWAPARGNCCTSGLVRGCTPRPPAVSTRHPWCGYVHDAPP